jgi:hypothetical protein
MRHELIGKFGGSFVVREATRQGRNRRLIVICAQAAQNGKRSGVVFEFFRTRTWRIRIAHSKDTTILTTGGAAAFCAVIKMLFALDFLGDRGGDRGNRE